MTAERGRQPIEIDAHPGLPRDDNGAAEGFDGAVAPDGTLYAIWSQDNDIMFTVSKDGGKTFFACPSGDSHRTNHVCH